MTSKALFRRGDLVEARDDGGMGLVLRIRPNRHVELDWIVYPRNQYRWVARDIHPDYDLVTNPELLNKVGHITVRRK